MNTKYNNKDIVYKTIFIDKTESLLGDLASSLTYLINPNSEAYRIYNKNKDCIGAIDFTLNKNYLWIEFLDIIENFQYKGYGKSIINHLFSIFNIDEIRGYASQSAVAFWGSIGAEFIDDCTNCDYYGCVYNPNRDSNHPIEIDCRCDDWSDRNFILRK